MWDTVNRQRWYCTDAGQCSGSGAEPQPLVSRRGSNSTLELPPVGAVGNTGIRKACASAISQEEEHGKHARSFTRFRAVRWIRRWSPEHPMVLERLFCSFKPSSANTSTSQLVTFRIQQGQPSSSRTTFVPSRSGSRHGGEQCSVIALASDGPRRSNVSLGTALALHQSGVYAVVDGGLQFGMSCSTQNATEAPFV